MADHTITVSNSLNVFGVAPSNKWEAFNWAAFTWGEGTADTICAMTKTIANDLASESSVSKHTEKLVEESLVTDADMGSEVLTDGSGYTYNFTDRATDGEDRDPTTWAEGSNSTTWAEGSVTPPDWDES